MEVLDAGADSGRPDAPARGFRPDIDGLRALAILVVVAFHAELPGFTGGFVGVDVFFVISGYLISRNLLQESEHEGRVALGRFWARRIRRLVPALGVMLVVTLLLAVPVLSSFDLRTAAGDARAAALYVSNFRFADQTSGYFAAGTERSVFLHTWSLGVEEQFYLAWPLVFAAVCTTSRRRRATTRAQLGFVLALILAGSLAWSLALTARGSTMAFFGPFGRAWEFAAAGLLVILFPRPIRTRWWRTVAASAGVAAIAWSTFAFDGSDTYPGARALIPCIGALLLIAACGSGVDDRTFVERILVLPPVRWIGRVSYSWYLWHWPLIVLAVLWLDDGSWRIRTAAAAASLAVAALAHHLVENPVRFSRSLASAPRATYALGAAVTAAALLATVVVDRSADAEVARSSLLRDVDQAKGQWLTLECPAERSTRGGVEYCEEGDAGAGRTVLVVGDSHGRVWQHAFGEAGRRANVRVVVRWLGWCPAIPVEVDEYFGIDHEGCIRFREDTASLVDELHPDAVVLVDSVGYESHVLDGRGNLVEDPDEQAAVWSRAFRDHVEELRRLTRVATVSGTPVLPTDPTACIAEHDALEPCTPSRSEALRSGNRLRAAEQRVLAEMGDVRSLDITHDLCDESSCRLAIDGTITYVDQSHLSFGYTRRHVDEIARLLDALVSGSG